MSKAARCLGERAPAPVVAGAGLTLAGCMILPFVLVAGATGLLHLEDLPLAAPSLVLVGYLALLPTALAYILFTVGMARCRTATVGVIAVMIEPAIAAFLAVCLLGERLGAAQVLGCTLLVGSISMLVGDFPRLRRHDRAAARPGDPVLVADAGAADNRPDIANAERPVSSDWRGKDAA
jgi:DME family drug/metabolite transporter